MSAWMVTDVHLSALVQEAMVRGLCQPDDMDSLWQQMKFSNQYALHCRYGDRLPFDEPSKIPVDRSSIEAKLDPIVVHKNIRCWNYQCAEYDGYHEIGCAVLMTELEKLIEIEHDVDDMYAVPGYEEAPWGIQSWGEIMDRSSWGGDPRKGSLVR